MLIWMYRGRYTLIPDIPVKFYFQINQEYLNRERSGNFGKKRLTLPTNSLLNKATLVFLGRWTPLKSRRVLKISEKRRKLDWGAWCINPCSRVRNRLAYTWLEMSNSLRYFLKLISAGTPKTYTYKETVPLYNIINYTGYIFVAGKQSQCMFNKRCFSTLCLSQATSGTSASIYRVS